LKYILIKLIAALIIALSPITTVFAYSGQEAEQFEPITLPSLNNIPTTIKPQNNKLLIINFFASWCPYCIKELPEFNSLYNKYGNQVQMYLIDTFETPDTANDFLYQNNYQIPTVYDNTYAHLLGKLKFEGIPTTFIINSDGVIVFRSNGMLAPGQLEAEINKYTAQRQLKQPDITGKWIFQDGSNKPSISLTLLPGGKIRGHSLNKLSWKLTGDTLTFFDSADLPIYRFYYMQEVSHKTFFIGKKITDEYTSSQISLSRSNKNSNISF
jgi:thiol-disulfide isomerase/thioredoxin